MHLSGRMWNPSALLPMVLSAAEGVTQISLLNMSYRFVLACSGGDRWSLVHPTLSTFRPTLDSSFSRLLHLGLLRRLRTLNLYGGCFLSLPVLRRLALCPQDCPRLTSLSFLQFEGIEAADVEAMRAEAANANLDIKICCLELFVD